MNAIQIVIKPAPLKISRQNLQLMFIKTAQERLSELDILKLKTQSAMGLDISGYWRRKHKWDMENIEENIKLNEAILIILDAKRERVLQ